MSNIVQWLPRYHGARKFFSDMPGGARVLDVACGEGDLTRFLAERGARACGVDLCEADIRKGLPRNRHPRACFVVADAGALPFADGSFDWVATFGTLQVLPDDTAAIREFDRVLKPGGILVVCADVRIPNAGDMFWPQRALRRWLPKWLYTRSRDPKTGRGWLESHREDLVYFRDYPLEEVLRKWPGFELLAHDYVLKWFSALAMDIAYGVRGFPRLRLKPYLYWVSTRLDALFCRGPKHRGYTLIAKLRKPS
jgi:SAM-dependent methyltransferase